MTGALQAGEAIVYEGVDGEVRVDVRLEQDTVRLTQQQMVEPFGRERSVIGKHVRNVFSEGELGEKSNVQNLHILPLTEKRTRSTTTASTSSSPSAIASNRRAARNSASGPPTRCASTWCAATHSERPEVGAERTGCSPGIAGTGGAHPFQLRTGHRGRRGGAGGGAPR